MPTAIYFTSGAEALVSESEAEVRAAVEGEEKVAVLTLPSGDSLHLRADLITHWHDSDARIGGGLGIGLGRGRGRSKPRFGRALPRTS